MNRLRLFIGALAIVATSVGAAVAQDAQDFSEPPQEVSGPEISILIRCTMVALHQANVTGNYTVLRELGSIGFQASNSPAQLTELFREYRERRVNLAAAVIFDAKLDEGPRLSTDGMLRLVGHFPTKPQEIVFDLTFRFERGDWRISSLNIETRVAAALDGRAATKQMANAGDPGRVPLPPMRPDALPRLQ
jgi:hypothetical protein